ncbi:MAG: hypothetical protein WC117_11465, partial [Sphaerochaetaceae bacterium]
RPFPEMGMNQNSHERLDDKLHIHCLVYHDDYLADAIIIWPNPCSSLALDYQIVALSSSPAVCTR